MCIRDRLGAFGLLSAAGSFLAASSADLGLLEAFAPLLYRREPGDRDFLVPPAGAAPVDRVASIIFVSLF